MWAGNEVVWHGYRVFVLLHAVEHRPFGKDEGEGPFVEGVAFEGVAVGEQRLGDGEEGRSVAIVLGLV